MNITIIYFSNNSLLKMLCTEHRERSGHFVLYGTEFPFINNHYLKYYKAEYSYLN